GCGVTRPDEEDPPPGDLSVARRRVPFGCRESAALRAAGAARAGARTRLAGAVGAVDRGRTRVRAAARLALRTRGPVLSLHLVAGDAVARRLVARLLSLRTGVLRARTTAAAATATAG